eukprot:g44185.t1
MVEANGISRGDRTGHAWSGSRLPVIGNGSRGNKDVLLAFGASDDGSSDKAPPAIEVVVAADSSQWPDWQGNITEEGSWSGLLPWQWPGLAMELGDSWLWGWHDGSVISTAASVPGTWVRFRPWATVCVEFAHSPRVCVGFFRVLR